MRGGIEELKDKASRAWFGISNVIFKNKRMEMSKVFGLFYSLVTPIALPLPFLVGKAGFTLPEKLVDAWETFGCEILNQKFSKIFLSVYSKSNRLAVLG